MVALRVVLMVALMVALMVVLMVAPHKIGLSASEGRF